MDFETSTATNQEQLVIALERVKGCLLARLGDDVAVASAETNPPTLDALRDTFGLSPFESDLLLLCAGVQLDSTVRLLCAQSHDDANRPYPTFGLALAVLPDAHWSALTPTAPLRYWRLVDVQPGPGLTDSELRIDERILHFLAGVQHMDEQLLGFVSQVSADLTAVATQYEIAEQIVTTWAQQSASRAPLVQLCGSEHFGQLAVASTVSQLTALTLYRLDVHLLPTTPHELDILQRLWEREAALSGLALVVDAHALDATDAQRNWALRHFAESLKTPLIIMASERRLDWERPTLTYDVAPPNSAEQRALWRDALGSTATTLNGAVDQLVSQFQLNPPSVQAAVWQLNGSDAAETVLWQACRTQARPRLDDLAQRIESQVGWDDLVLPERELATLHTIATQLRQRRTVYETWGFAQKSPRGLGLSALFAGPSGTGKTLAAEVLANELRLDLYKIDLSQVVSKYIGETEKNLARVFDSAEAGGAILLFDEADALFGKRGEVKDSHDRYANIEVSYLLQRMEAYRGLAILTTNMKQALDTAFLRRLRFIVNFRFPDAEQRVLIWQHIFPAQTPTQGLDATKLAQLNVAGGNIRNIALGAAFNAAAAGEPVSMAHLLEAARAEYVKLDKTLSSAEVRDWGVRDEG